MTRDEYWSDVKDTVRSMWSDYELSSADECYDAVHELADRHVTYTSTALATMQHTSNPDAFDDCGLDGCSSWSEVVTRAAYFAYSADLVEEAQNYNDEEILDLRGLFRCPDCGEVVPQAEGQEPPADLHPEELLCEDCYLDLVEDFSDGSEGEE